MTLSGAIAELVMLYEHSMMPAIFKSSIQKIIETVSECELPSAQPEHLCVVMDKISKAYEKAINMSYIHNPMAWALYQVWKEYDR